LVDAGGRAEHIVEPKLEMEHPMVTHRGDEGCMTDKTKDATDVLGRGSLSLSLRFEDGEEEYFKFLAFLEGPPHCHTTRVDGITQEIEDPVAVILPFLRVDGRWAIDIVFRSSEGFVTCPDACIRNVEEVSSRVGDSCIVDEDWHPSFRIRGIGILNERVNGVGDGLCEGGDFRRGRFRWENNARC
jgi:hypothetical protein